MLFTGRYEHSIDSKKRLAIPSEIRSQLLHASQSPGDVLRLYVMLGEGQALCLYTEQGFEQRAKELDQSQLDLKQLLSYERVMYSTARRVELDKQGRIRLPDDLLTRSKLGSDVLILGVKDHLEVRDKATWDAYLDAVLADQSDFLDQPLPSPPRLMNPRQAMRPDELTES